MSKINLKGRLVGSNFYHGGLAVKAALKHGDDLLLVREPANQYDPNAIAVYAKIGHIDRTNAAIFSNVFDNDRIELDKGKVLRHDDGTIEIETSIAVDLKE